MFAHPMPAPVALLAVSSASQQVGFLCVSPVPVSSSGFGRKPCSAEHAGSLLVQTVTVVPVATEVTDLVWYTSADLGDKFQKSNNRSGHSSRIVVMHLQALMSPDVNTK